jgi:hypothetical protein
MQPLVFLLDVDNTLLDNDAIKKATMLPMGWPIW